MGLREGLASRRKVFTLRRVLAGLATRATANECSQRILDKAVEVAHYLQGVGSGGDLFSSGEAEVLLWMRDAHEQRPLQIFDVGANVGNFVLMARTILPAGGHHIHCFDPGAATFAGLCE